MKILFLLSCLEPAGSETYCVALARAWQNRHDIFWISDRLHFGQTYTSLPIHEKAFPGGVQNTLKVMRYVREHGIEIIHSHSRRAHWIAAQVSVWTNIPHVTTIHQPPPVHLFSRMFPCLGDYTIAIDEAVQDHLQRHFGRGLHRISLIRNGIDVSGNTAPSVPPMDNRILYLGRMSGGRWRALQFFFNVLKRSAGSLPKAYFQIVGHVPKERISELQNQLKEVNQAIHPSFVETHDFVNDLTPLLAGCKGVIAGGRSALESMAAGRPVIALGEQGVVGLCAEDNWAEAMRTNFGDHFQSQDDQFYPAKLEVALRQLLENSAASADLGQWSRAQVEKHYNIKRIAPAIEKVYEDLRS